MERLLVVRSRNNPNQYWLSVDGDKKTASAVPLHDWIESTSVPSATGSVGDRGARHDIRRPNCSISASTVIFASIKRCIGFAPEDAEADGRQHISSWFAKPSLVFV
jgi:hypothetical protein